MAWVMCERLPPKGGLLRLLYKRDMVILFDIKRITVITSMHVCMWRNIFCRQPTRYWGPMSNISRRMNLKNIEDILVDIPDAQFRAYLAAEFDTNSDGILTPQEAASVTSIWCSSRQISSLQGIELFTNLTILDCSFNEITELPQLPSKLTTLNCSSNNIAEFNQFAYHTDDVEMCI